MPETPPPSTIREFFQGVISALPIAAAAVPIGLLFGALAAGKGLSTLEAGLMSALVFAGAAQFVAIGIWTDPAPWALLGLTALTVNLRHAIMGVSLVLQFKHFGRAERWFNLFFLTDEVWALSEKRASERPLYPAYYMGIAVSLIVTWTAGTVAGTILGARLGPPERYGLDFIFTALFLGLVIGFWKGPKTGIVIAISGLFAAVAHELIDGPWYIVIGGLAGTAAGALTFRSHREQEA
ncbi:4-azaleucine resistance transporter AzlC [Rhodoligotrophos appendicifer]|uniref:AzlC family ABC transporter permease n=1 Tax=Rhodoligotrophos appendicifer TaxID=987056 RepID=UPI001185CF33|nr:AzlC family ABC transporter permease [Rhodoligotrophos appendicifer]